EDRCEERPAQVQLGQLVQTAAAMTPLERRQCAAQPEPARQVETGLRPREGPRDRAKGLDRGRRRTPGLRARGACGWARAARRRARPETKRRELVDRRGIA